MRSLTKCGKENIYNHEMSHGKKRDYSNEHAFNESMCLYMHKKLQM